MPVSPLGDVLGPRSLVGGGRRSDRRRAGRALMRLGNIWRKKSSGKIAGVKWYEKPSPERRNEDGQVAYGSGKHVAALHPLGISRK